MSKYIFFLKNPMRVRKFESKELLENGWVKAYDSLDDSFEDEEMAFFPPQRIAKIEKREG